MKTIFSILTIACFLPVSMVSKNGAHNQLQEESLNKLAQSLSHLGKFDLSIKKSNPRPVLMEFAEDYWHCLFKSKKTVEPQTYLRFGLSHYRYPNSHLARTGMKNYFLSVDPEFGFSKSWEYFLRVDGEIYWLSGPCLLSEKNWFLLRKGLKELVPIGPGSQIEEWSCRCGDLCGRLSNNPYRPKER